MGGMGSTEQFDRLMSVMHRLRQDCPWDRAQTHRSLRPYLLEEAYEVLHALDEERYDDLREELGDLLLQVVFHAEVAQEQGRFDIEGVLKEITDKLIRRHPHVFEDVEAQTAEDVLKRWEHIKKRQERKDSLLDGVPAQLPALLQAVRVLSKMHGSGLDPWHEGQALLDCARWLEALSAASAADDAGAAEHAVGMLALSMVAACRPMHVNPEDALRSVVRRLAEAVRHEEARLAGEGRSFADLSAEELSRISARLLASVQGRQP